MKYTLNNTRKGLIKTVIVVIIALLILSYFGFNLRELADSPTTKENFSYATTFVSNVWETYLKKPVLYLWNDIFLKLIWNPAIEALQGNSKDKESTYNLHSEVFC